MSKVALITGIAGQDGSYLAELLLDLGYSVHGLIRRNSTPEHQESRIASLESRVTTYYSDVLDTSSLAKLFRQVKPDEIYNLAAQSHVRVSFEVPQFTLQTNGLGVLNVLEAMASEAPNARLYQASSSEMFGDSVDADGFQRESTPMTPVSPYGAAKLYGYNMVRNYRASYNLFASNGILFNHESPRRGSNFVTSKIVKTAVQIKLGLADKLVLGNLDSYRDWGHSRDYVRAMHLILNHGEPDDFVVATGQTTSVREFVDLVFTSLGLQWQEFVVQDAKFMRPQELPYLKGDSSKVRKVLGWRPVETIESLVQEMVEHWISVLSMKG